MGGCDGVDAAADRVAGGRVDERQRGAARAERRPPGERTADARARERDAGGPEQAGIGRAEAVDRRADPIAEQGGAEAEHGEEGEGEPCHRHVSFRQVIPHRGRTVVLGTGQPLLERRHPIEAGQSGRPWSAGGGEHGGAG